MSSRPDRPSGEILIEFVRSGAYLKCAAVCAVTGREAVAIGPASDPAALERLAVAKLKRLLQADR